MCAYMGTSDRLVSGFSLFHCGLWQLKTHQGRRTDPVTPNTHVSELEAWAIVTFPPIVPWERTISVSCCSRSDKTSLLNMRKPPPLKYTNTHTCRKHMTAALLTTYSLSYTHTHTHTHPYHLILTFLLDTLLKAYMRTGAENTGTLQEK